MVEARGFGWLPSPLLLLLFVPPYFQLLRWGKIQRENGAYASCRGWSGCSSQRLKESPVPRFSKSSSSQNATFFSRRRPFRFVSAGSSGTDAVTTTTVVASRNIFIGISLFVCVVSIWFMLLIGYGEEAVAKSTARMKTIRSTHNAHNQCHSPSVFLPIIRCTCVVPEEVTLLASGGWQSFCCYRDTPIKQHLHNGSCLVPPARRSLSDNSGRSDT